ncbi:conserved hypothetical protein [Leishmania braziliensis MHOM/BR/75/M2904]|uniref:Radical SAM core domain-containing protein n=2 Tax=Leishmania braziliensis TaxID=5660 RepID=A4H8C2_LEIBR|nr:conserved hypothetical protein [Leishmania braziliensis MHOM/BR/75/M2904]CAJ2469493.1 unnamed protein product [Leishmania braziliensis]CAM42171.1 conserved hypothetical protein [Leishmania braziliensis MHOM/BR/75/M2904]SYZ64284.1 Radical_SAM_superfamily/Wyosine_base_formation [Leishmania braziliensis MHOM/BR/75/M2904]
MQKGSATGCRPMLSEKRREALGTMYSLVGTHSAVKLCRWQKSMMRGRGGCYKWTMYGIKSHRCMEATPSMACANNCVFCWRLNSNPTAAEWKWMVDEPKEVVEGMISSHQALINGVRGMPGVTDEALEEALAPRHCALSLVGEPIMYPYVNEFLRLLHAKSMSSFLVNNGQFPDAIRKLAPVTQLYLSVDAPNKKTMKILDRPVLPDYWERFNESVNSMREKKHRTVFRLTMIDGFNMEPENLPEYKELFDRGQPHFIEIKRLTPAFSGNHNTILRIKNVPSWEKMKAFAQQLCNMIGKGRQYTVASIHEHSGCILLAHQRFVCNGRVHSWIDYDKFDTIIQDPERAADMVPEDYLLPTPTWALPDSPAEGFDPAQKRHISNKRRKHMESMAAPPPKHNGRCITTDEATAVQSAQL